MDNTFPKFHFRPKKNWINDPNGTIYHNGYYHIFYQYNPYSDCWGNLHWGHARTKDFINYEIINENLYPQNELGETDCFSGCIAINKDNTPIALYTSVALNNEELPNIQKAVSLDGDLIHFESKRIDALTIDMKNLPKMRNDWRDPYVFKADDRYFLVLSAAIGNFQEPAVLLFESLDKSLINWTYLKELVKFKPIIELFECPNFFKLEDKWVLLGSPYNAVEYYVGTFNINTLDFEIETKGLIDYCAQYYATNTIQDNKNRTITFAFERGFSKNKGWNNVISIPRKLSLDKEKKIIQEPIFELQNLRIDKIIDISNLHLDKIKQIESEKLVQCEIDFDIDLKNTLKTNLLLKNNKIGIFQVLFSTNSVKFDSIFIPFEENNNYHVKIFIDHSIIELYLDNGKHCSTRVIENLKDINILEFRGNSIIKNLTIYELDSINIIE